MPYVKTIGNATLIVCDPKPLLVTDPWLGDSDPAYFGSWTLAHEIPPSERAEILDAENVWFSHGHPDHLNPTSVHNFKSKRILLPNHVGQRIQRDLDAEGFRTQVLPDRTWVELSERVRIMCLPDYIQDAALLVDVNGHLFINLNDCGARGTRRLIQSIVSNYEHSYLLKLSGGDADMINLFDEDEQRLEIPQAHHATGRDLSDQAKRYGAKNVIPFSSFHRYQREDSIWANAHTTPMDAYQCGFDERVARFIWPFASIDCSNGDVVPIDCKPMPFRIRSAAEFGDNWDDTLSPADEELLRRYMLRHERLHRYIGFINFRVGGRMTSISFSGPPDKGITFHVPANSLMTAVRYEIFDDLLIGNFARTTLHNLVSLYDPPFNFLVAKFGDNGRATTELELRRYMQEYRYRGGRDLVMYTIEEKAMQLFRRYVATKNPLYSLAKQAYYALF